MSLLATLALTASLVAPVPMEAPVQLDASKPEISTMAVTNYSAVANYFQTVHPSTANLGKSTTFTGVSGNYAYFTIERKTSSEYAAHITVNRTTGAFDIEFYWYENESGVLPANLR